MNQTQTKAILKDLKDSSFIDRQSRSVVVDLVVYNSYLDFFTHINFIAVFEANGLITTTVQLYDIKRDYYSNTLGYIRLICEICFCCLLVFYYIIELIEIVSDIQNQKKDFEKTQKKKEAQGNKRKSAYLEKDAEGNAIQDPSPELGKNANKSGKSNTPANFGDLELREGDDKKENDKEKKSKKKAVLHYCSFVVKGIKEHYNDGWNWIDTSFLIMSLIAVIIWASIVSEHTSNVTNKSFKDFRDVKNNENFLSIAFKLQIYQRICSINFILIFIKVLKYLASWFERAMIIFKTLSYAKSDIFYFLIMYIIIFFAFVVMCHIYYGADLTNFGTILNSLKTLFLMLLGDLDYLDDMVVLNKVLSFFFFIAFMTSMQFILINMFIAFISNAYSAVNESISSSKKLEDELKQKHLLIRMKEAFLWLRDKVQKNKKKKEQQQKNLQKNKDIIQKSMVKKVQNMMKIMKDQKFENNVEQNQEVKIKNARYLFGTNRGESRNDINDSDDDKKDKEPNSFEKQNISDLALGLNIFGEDKKNQGTTNSFEVTSRMDDLHEDELEGDLNNDSNLSENILKARLKMEEEKAKNILTRKEWDKNFDQNQFFVEEPLFPALQSEKQDDIGKKERELRCGKIMWASIIFTLYATLYITLILYQLNVERNYWYNTALKNAILGLQDSKNFVINDIKNYQMLVDFLRESLPTLANPYYQQKTNFTGYYIQDVNYILGDTMRICFKLSQIQVPDDEKNDSPYYISDYYKDMESDHEFTSPFLGDSSNDTYYYSSDGFQHSGSYCKEFSFNPDAYALQIDRFVSDHIINDRLLQLTIEFVTFEASQYVHTYSTILFKFPADGSVQTNVNIYTMKLNQYQSKGDFVRLAFEGIYVILLVYNMVIFVKKLINKSKQYQRWKRIEIDSLSEIERKQRHQKQPEWIRQWNALFISFTYFDIIYFTLAITSIVLWISYIQGASLLDFPLPPSKDNAGFIPKFYEVQRLLMNYTNVVAINTIFLSVKVFDYMNKSKHMNMLSNTLYSAKEDTFYFLIIFAIFLFGFVGMSYISFGSYLSDFNTIGNAIRKCFEITIGDFDYQSLEDTNAPMAIIFFFPFNVLFVFILTNIFLAIINEAYEANQLASEDYDSINVLQSIFYCMIPNENRNQKQNNRKSAGIDKKSSQNDYLEVFEKLVVNLQISMSDLKAWAINCADEIKSELKRRTQLRHENREIMLNKFKKMKTVEEGSSGGTGVVGQGKKFDEVECYKKRLQYWDYIRNGIQFISFQNRILQAVLQQKEKEIQEKTELYYKEKEKTQEIYKYLALLEKPVEDRLEQIMNYRKVISLLDQEKNILINEEEKEDNEGETKNDPQNKSGDGEGEDDIKTDNDRESIKYNANQGARLGSESEHSYRKK